MSADQKVREYYRLLKLWVQRVRQDRNLVSLLKDSSLLYIAGIFSIGLTFIQQISTANLLGTREYGQFATVLGSSVFLILVIDIRTWELGTKLLASSIHANDPGEIVRLTNWFSLFDIILGVLGTVVLFLFSEVIAVHLLKEPELVHLVRLYSLCLPFKIYAAGIPVALIRLYNQYTWLAFKSILYAVTRLLLITGAALIGLGLEGVVVAALLSEVVNCLILVVLTIKVWHRHLKSVSLLQFKKPQRFSEMLRLIPSYWIFGTLKSFQMEAFIPLTAALSNPAQVGLLKIGIDIADLILKLISPLAIVISPNIIKSYETGSRTQFLRTVKQSAALLSGLVIPFTGAIVFVGPFVFPRLLDSEYHSAIPIIILLAIGYGFNAAFLWTRPTLVAVDLINEQNIASFILTIITITALFVAVPSFGALGTAGVIVSFFVTFSLVACMIFVFNQNKLAKLG